MRLLKFSFVFVILGFCFFGLSYGAASRLEQSKSYSYPESIARHYAQVSGRVFEGGSFGSGEITEFKKSLPIDPNADIDSIDVETVAVDVEFLPSETDSLEVSLASSHVDPNEPVLIDTSRGKTIHISTQEGNRDRVGRHGWMIFNFDSDSDSAPIRKNVLQIRIPKSVSRGQIQTVSGNALLATALSTLKFQSKSGDARIATGDNPLARVETLTIDTVSGDLKGPGRFDHLRFNSVSGDVDISSLDRVLDIDGHSVSGDLEIKTTEPLDVEVSFNSKSGDVKIAKEFNVAKSLTKNATFRVGRGTTHLAFQTVSGDLKIKHAKPAAAGNDDEDDGNDDESGRDDHLDGARDTSDDEALFHAPTVQRNERFDVADEGYLGCVARIAIKNSSKLGATSTQRCVRFFAQI
jgi:hypothetical protein